MDKKKVLVINRAKWRNGGDSNDLQDTYDADKCDKFGETFLLNDDGFMCCLGFDAVACGIPKNDILNTSDPISLIGNSEDLVDSTLKRYARFRIKSSGGGTWCDNSAAVKAALSANDDSTLTPTTREKRVRAALLKLGWDEVKFVGVAPKGM